MLQSILQLKQLGFNLVYAMALGGLQSVCDALMLARHQQYISDTEFILLFECNLSKPLFPY